MILAALLLLLVPAAAPGEETNFEPGAAKFADAAACTAHLQRLAGTAEAKKYEIVRGPYAIGEGDVRVHMVRAEGSGHRIWEHRCLDNALSSRSWNHSMEAAEEEFTVESAAGKAEWLNKAAPKQQQ